MSDLPTKLLKRITRRQFLFRGNQGEAGVLPLVVGLGAAGMAVVGMGSPAPGVEIQDEGTVKGKAKKLDFTGAGVTASLSGDKATINVPGGGGSDSLKVKATSADTTEDFLNPKIAAGTGITKTVLNPGANEQVQLTAHLEDHKARHASGGADIVQEEGSLVFVIPGTQVVMAKLGPINLYAPFALTITEVHIAVNTAPTGASLIVDVNKNGTTIFTTQSNRPTIAASGTSATSGTPDVTSVAKNDLVTVDADQVGSTEPGKDLVIQVRFKKPVTT